MVTNNSQKYLSQTINVGTGTLSNLMLSVSSGEYRIPQFQREYVWERTKVNELFDSIFNQYPIGSVFLWNAGREYNSLFRHSVNLGIKPVEKDDNIKFVLDGQQRITSLYLALNGLSVSNTDYSHVCFDAENSNFAHREPNSRRYFSVSEIWGNGVPLIMNAPQEYALSLQRCWTALQNYPVSIVEVKDKDLEAVSKIFRRINQGGKRLDRFDLISAIAFTEDFDLRERIKTDLISKLEEADFGAIAPTIVT